MYFSFLMIRMCLCFVQSENPWTFKDGVYNFPVNLPNFEKLQENEIPAPPIQPEVIDKNDRADNPKAWIRRGIILLRDGRYEDALLAFNQAILLKKNDAEAWNYKGEALFKLARRAEALAAFNQALEIRPRLTRAVHNKGAVLLGLGRLKEALTVYELLIQRNASDAKAWKEKAEVLFRLGHDFKALHAVVEALDIKPGFQDAVKLKKKLEAKIQSLRFNL